MNTNCNCIEEVKNLVIKASGKEDYNIVSANFRHRTIYPDKRLYSVFDVKFTFRKKNGTISKPRSEQIDIHYRFCPFCGKIYSNPDEEKQTQKLKDTIERISTDSVLTESDALEIIQDCMISDEWLDFFAPKIIELANKREKIERIKIEVHLLMLQRGKA